MRLKKNLKCSGQAIVEYIAVFAVLLVGIVMVFGGFNPGYETNLSATDKVGRPVILKLGQAFQAAANGVVNSIASWR
jgi:hypothetical protein